ncbi:L-Ala-D/L-amino acid epimerase [Hondaea fermentalgiana]|uniref:L-Ala-D/L-amino acid epimerase n=1 Tax=Hondaea fermentalgiana TaxID=2315210 RepID=A0A2R5G3H2_9STRA|nr:L-Ala-D/L-amino acid epimerase [Hondaea fermentalgiana]|eukprot:GBG25562.1 L-Ala-D/L-amino acid epimerase [Hondaea fermentalgiana]
MATAGAGAAAATLRAWGAHVAGLETFESPDGKIALLKLTTSDGIEGWGQFGNKDVDLTVEIFHRRVAPAAMGALVRDPAALVERIVGFELNYKQLGVQLSKALAGLDAAVWDACGKFAQCTVCELLCARPLSAFPVYASSISRKIAPQDLADEMARLKQTHGVRAFKVKAGKRMQGLLARGQDPKSKQEDQWPGRTAAVLRAVREAVGPECELMVDANGAYPSPATDSTDGAFVDGVCKMLREYGVSFFEEPFFWCDYDAYRHLRDREGRAGLPVAGGEQEFRMDVWRAGLPLDIYQPDFGYAGGPSSILQIAQFARRDGRRFVPHSPQGDLHVVYALHVASALSDPQLDRIELACVDDGLCQVFIDTNGTVTSMPQITGTPLRLKHGHLDLEPQCHGWGVEIDPVWLRADGVKSRVFDAKEATSKRSNL